MRWSLLVLVACSLLAVSPAMCVRGSDPQGVVAGDYRVDFVGNSGQIKLYPPSNPTSFLKVQWLRLQEIDSQGKEVQGVNNFASSPMSWSNPAATTLNGYNATIVTLSTIISFNGKGSASQQANVRIDTLIFQTDATIIVNNASVTVPKNNIKWNLHVDNWPFQSAKNNLTFEVQVLSGGSHRRADGAQDGARDGDSSGRHGHRGSVRYAFGPGNLDLATTAVLDDTQTVEIDSRYFSNGNIAGVQLIFPSFTNSLDYDPTMAFTATTTSSASSAVATPLAMLLATLALVATAAVRL